MEDDKGITINMGPVHPATHGVLKVVLDIKGDTIKKARTEIGFLHRGKEKLAEVRYFSNYYPIVDKLDYVSALNMEILYACLVEKAAGIDVPPRATYIRTIMGEIQRIMSHLLFIGAFGEDVGNITGFIWAFRERELLMNVVEMVSGGRLAPMYLTNGGVFYDLPDGFAGALLPALDKIEDKLKKDYRAMFQENDLFRVRTKGIGVITKDMVIKYGLTGPNMRASGFDRDLRRDDPYLVYDKMDFEVVTEEGGDALARFMVRTREITESIKIIRQALKSIPGGPVRTKVPWLVKIPPKYTFVRHEAPRGEMAMYMITDGSDKPYRLKIRSPTFFAVRALEEMMEGQRIADAVVDIASIDPVMGEVDR